MNVRLTPHSEQLLREELARGRFRTPEEVIEHALESLNGQESANPPNQVADLDEFDAVLDALAEGSEKLPSLPDRALTRQSFYQDHD